MIRLLLSWFLLATAAGAQSPVDADPPPGPTLRQNAGLYAAGVGVGAATFVGGLVVIDALAPPGDETALLLVPAGVALGVTAGTLGLGRAMGVDGTARGAALGAAVGTVPGVVLVALSLTIPDINALGPAIAGAYLTVGLVPLGAVIGYGWGDGRRVAVAPTALAVPTGETAPGLALRVGL